jgi:thiamine biosynthesis protein ThiI
MMVRIAERIATRTRADALITGDSLGQVASQTLGNLKTIEDIAGIPILRPLIGDDKQEIVNLAQQIGTFEVSTQPHQDCCSLFVPNHPATNAALDDVREAEEAIDTDTLVDKAVESIEELSVTP